MKNYIFEFRKAVRKADVIDDNSDFVNDFMFHNNLYGENIYNELIKELEELKMEINFEEFLLTVEEQNRFAKGVLTSCASSFINYLDAYRCEGKMCVSNGECEDIENAFHNAMWDRLHRYYCKYIEKQGEKKSAWSDDDEQYLLVCKNALAKYQTTDKWDASIISCWLDDKLKSIRPQTKKEWDKADKEYRDAAIYYLRSYCNPYKVKPILEWLEKLEPKSHWKPSDEQMNALANALSLAKNCGEESSFDLHTLYEQLKKLKEE